MSSHTDNEDNSGSLFAHTASPIAIARYNAIMTGTGVRNDPPRVLTLELTLIGAVGTAFDNTTDLHVKRASGRL